jgi:uracil-DNA glycosylase family 4
MRGAVEAIAEELRRLKASGVTSVAISEESIALLRRAAASRRPAAPAARPAGAPPAAAPPEARAEPARKAPRRAAPAAPAEPLPPPPTVTLPAGTRQERWDALLALVRQDPVCASRVRPGKKVVLGVGRLDADIMFVGEAPGAEEEVQGEPFVGPAGQLLTKMIAAMALSRSDVYIGNIMNWRPDLPVGPDGVQTGNRPPTDAEMAHFMPYLHAQVSIVEPKILVALGATAAKGLLGPGSFEALGEVRGRWHQFDGRPLMVTYHPSYILRNPINRMKRLIWEDLLKVMERAKLPITDKQRGYFLN